jgi:galactose mutarotase-like enzyme
MGHELEQVVLESEEVRLALLPEVGCKLTSLEFRRYDFQWLWQDPHRPVRKADFCSDYSDYDISGFDECFPNIGVSDYPPDSSVKLCDHGEVWAKPWRVETMGNSVVAEVDLTAMPLTFRREIKLDHETIEFHYQVTNRGAKTFWYMWSAHPLFRLPNGYRVIAPTGQKMFKEFGIGGRLGEDGTDHYNGHLDELTWPVVTSASGQKVDVSQVIPDLGVVDKVAVETEGIRDLTLLNEDLGAGLKFAFSPEVSHVGICSNLTGWPPGPHPGTWIAIEPMIGISDRLDENIDLGVAKPIEAGATQGWNFSITLTDWDKD